MSHIHLERCACATHENGPNSHSPQPYVTIQLTCEMLSVNFEMFKWYVAHLQAHSIFISFSIVQCHKTSNPIEIMLLFAQQQQIKHEVCTDNSGVGLFRCNRCACPACKRTQIDTFWMSIKYDIQNKIGATSEEKNTYDS